ncbi:MAG: uridine kinase [Verrucomicrobia bacterium]|jgi:uridine kinase|nr:uridine kinase [Verrucomicrobiota bacterium]
MNPFLIAIAGGSGAGKTWLARELAGRLSPHAAVLSLDDFYRDLSHLPVSERSRQDFDVPTAIDWPCFVRAMRRIRQGQPAVLPRYDFPTHTRLKEDHQWTPVAVVIVEGLWPYWRSDLEKLFDWRWFKRGTAALRQARRLRRDRIERGRTTTEVEAKWRNQVIPGHIRFVQPQLERAQVVLPGVVTGERLDWLAAKIRWLVGLDGHQPALRTGGRGCSRRC